MKNDDTISYNYKSDNMYIFDLGYKTCELALNAKLSLFEILDAFQAYMYKYGR